MRRGAGARRRRAGPSGGRRPAWSPTMKVGHAPHAVLARRRPRAPADVDASGSPWRSRRTPRRRRRPAASSVARTSRLVAQVAALVVAQREERLVGVEEPVGRTGPAPPRRPGGRAGRCRPPARSQMSGSPSATCTWPSENGHERDVPRGAGPEPRDHVLVGVAGERAAVVPGDGEGGGRESVTPGPTPRRPRAFRQRLGGQSWRARMAEADAQGGPGRARRRRGGSSRRRGSTATTTAMA